MPQSLVSLMANAYPTAALVENGRVTEKWVGEMPQAYMDRVRGFFEAITVPVTSAAAARRLRRVIPVEQSAGAPAREVLVDIGDLDDVLKAHEAFRALPAEELATLARRFTPLVFRMGDVVLQPPTPIAPCSPSMPAAPD